MARTFVALGLFLATSIGFAGPAPAQYNPQYNNPQYNPQSQYNPQPQYNNPRTDQGYQGNPGYQGGQQGGYQGNQGYQGGYQGNQTGCPYGQQFDPSQNRCVYNLPGRVTVPGQLLGR